MNTESTKTIVEINGIKMEVDLRHATVVHQDIRVGSKVKLLVKSTYGSPEVYPGVVVGFEPFKELPTIIVAYISRSYSNLGLQFAYVNKASTDKYDMVPSVDDELPVEKNDVLAQFDRDLETKRAEVATIQAKRDFFLKHFNMYFTEGAAA